MTSNEIPLRIRPGDKDPDVAGRPSSSLAESLPDVCVQHGKPARTWQDVRIGFATREIGPRQITYLRGLLKGKGFFRVFRKPRPDFDVTARWPRCSLCLTRTIFFHVIAWMVLVAAVVPVALFCNEIVGALVFDRRPNLAGNVVTAAPYALVYGIAFTHGAFSYARPVLKARLNEKRTALLVPAHPVFVSALEEIRRHPPTVSTPTIW